MKLDTDRWAVLSGVATDKGASQKLNESVTMGMAGPGFAPVPKAGVPNSTDANETEELRRLRLVIREEVAAVLSEIKAEKDLAGMAAAADTKSVSATMGFSGPGFGATPKAPQTQEEDPFARRAPTAGMIPGLGF